MKKTALLLSLFFICNLVLSPFCAYASFLEFSSARFELIPLDYEGEIYDANELSEGLFMVCGNGHYSGYIDKDGKNVVDFNFAYAGSFKNSLAPAKVAHGKIGYIGTDGKFDIEPQFDAANDFSDSLALVRKGNKTGFIDKTGRFVDILKNSSYTPISSFNHGVCWVENEDGNRALMNLNGELVSDFDFVWSGEYSDGVCWASTDMGDDFNNINMGLIDTDGKFLIEPGKYTYASPYNEGVCWAKKSGSNHLFLIDKKGNRIAEINASLMPSNFSNGICVNIGGDLLSIMNTEGITIYSTSKYVPVHYGGFSEGAMLVKRKSDGKYFIMQDNNYTQKEQMPLTEEFVYEKVISEDTNIEIALMVDTCNALVNGTKTMIDNADSRVCAFVHNGRTLLPMRFIAENLPGYSVSWDYISSSALVQSSYLSVLLKPDVPKAEIIRYLPKIRFYETNEHTLDQPPVNLYDRLFLPVRALCDIIGIKVFYDERGLVVLSNTRNTLGYDEASEIIDKLMY